VGFGRVYMLMNHRAHYFSITLARTLVIESGTSVSNATIYRLLLHVAHFCLLLWLTLPCLTV
jgi:hypothetical protein